MGKHNYSNYTASDVEKEAMKLVNNELAAWENEEVFITDKVSFMLRNVIKQARKNYFGVFNQLKDSATGRNKTWVPLTEQLVNAVRNFIDLDTKDIGIKAKKPSSFEGARILRFLLFSKLGEWNFGQVLNKMLLYLPLDGIVYFKVWREGKEVKMYIPDSLNMYQDPAKEAGEGVLIERAIMPMSAVDSMAWDNKEFLSPQKDFKDYKDGAYLRRVEIDSVVIYERFGEMSKYLITEKESDMDTIIQDGHIIMTASESGQQVCLLREEKKNPFEAVASTFVPNRYVGRGTSEKLFDIQEYLNEIINIRRNRGHVSQNLLWHIRKGSGIRRQDVSALRGGGAIVSKSKDDITQLPIQDYSASSYSDENDMISWANKAINFSPQAGGQALPSSTPATIGLLQQQASESTFSIIKEDVGLFLKRVFENHLIPLLIETLTDDEIVMITGEPKDLEELDKEYTTKIVNKEITEIYRKTGVMPAQEIIEAYKAIRLENFAKQGDSRFVKINKRLLEKVDVEVFVTNESFDKAVMVKQLNDLLLTYSRIEGVNLPVQDITRSILDIMGLKNIKLSNATPAPLPQAQGAPQQRGISRPSATPAEKLGQQPATPLQEITKASKLRLSPLQV